MHFFLMVPWVGLQCAIVTFPGHTHLSTHCIVLYKLTIFIESSLNSTGLLYSAEKGEGLLDMQYIGVACSS